jgi:hypothetical protein
MVKGMRVFPIQRPHHVATISSWGEVFAIEGIPFGRERRRDGGGQDLHEKRMSEMSCYQGGWESFEDGGG